MFSSLGLFKDIPCPKQSECDLPNCIFSHLDHTKQDEVISQEYDPLSREYDPAPAAKRQKLDDDTSRGHEDYVVPISSSIEKAGETLDGLTPASIASSRSSSRLVGQPKLATGNNASVKASARSITPPKASTLKTFTRTVSPPPPILKSTRSSAAPGPRPKSPESSALKKEPLIPRTVRSQPVPFQKRDAILKKFHALIQSKENECLAADSAYSATKLLEAEVIKFVLDKEETAAHQYEGVAYQSHLGKQMLDIKKMSTTDWHAFIKTAIRNDPEPKSPSTSTLTVSRPSTGLPTLQASLGVLRGLKTSLSGLEKHSYVTTPPTAAEITSAKESLASSHGYEVCDRCNTHFQVYPGRSDDGKLTSGGGCHYHWARPQKPPSQPTDRNTGGSQVSYPCCGTTPGTPGCTRAESHVYNIKDPKRLATILQFEHTPENLNIRSDDIVPVSFDCEMAYTTLGMEVIRVTAVSWPAGNLLVDFLVRPYGEILDLNTRFSGVTAKQFSDAPAYPQSNPDSSNPTPSSQKSLQAATSSSNKYSNINSDPHNKLMKVSSPAAARTLLFTFLNPTTPLMGHAIDNDLNTLRIIHPFIIDTALLYPHPRGLPYRNGLRALTSQYLKRNIQASGAQGHDSKEDAIATGDLVTVKVAEKWQVLKVQGWSVEWGKLVPPVQVGKAAKAVS